MVWKQVRTAAVGGAAVAAVWAVVALAAPAQQGIPAPDAAPFVPMQPKKDAEKAPAKLGFPVVDEAAPPKAEQEKLPPLKMDNIDPAVIPAAGTASQPGAPRPVASPPPRGSDVPDPPHPVVRIRVRVPADAAPGDDIKYIITVQNVSSADAHAVTVRNPLSAEVEAVVKSDPEPDKTLSAPGKQLVWSFGTLKAGQNKTIELILRHKDGAAQLKNLAYVKFEHGESVTTKIAKPTIKVTKTAPKQTVRDEAFTVRLLVENTGRVPTEGVRVVENVPASAEVEAITTGGKRLQQPEGQQWMWEIAKLQPGERKVIEYRVTPREGKDVFTLTSVSGQKLVADKPAEGRTQVLVPGIEVKLTGPTGVVNAGESARYEIVVRNTGTLPSTNVKITGTIPGDCKPTMKTDGGQIYRDSIVWQLPRLEPGEAQSFRFAIKASTTGRRVVVASATDARGLRAGQELATVFAGTAALAWETTFNPLTVQVGKQGTFTVKVKNTGGDVARNVRVQIDVPDAVSVKQVTPTTRIENNIVAFGVETIPAYGEVTYTLTFEGRKADQAWFVVRMSADCLGDRPMKTEKMVEVIGGPK
jgi:uncharacterized repeat protein (TIGR01451 family)